MEGIINPRPLDADTRLVSLVDALDESIARRVVSVDNGVQFQNGRGWSTIEMPAGYDIYETTGAWEDYATPSRDMRLLISIDAVRSFPDAVARVPEQFGLGRDEADAAAERLRARLAEILAERRFSYQRSDGSTREVTLADVVARASGFEMSYNPNDCVEIRWAAPEGSDEMSTCNHRAPRDQRARMESYRSWFATRRRPPR
jgi:hypothetical protein